VTQLNWQQNSALTADAERLIKFRDDKFCRRFSNEISLKFTVSVSINKLIPEVSNFKYLGSYTQSTEADLKVKKAVAWKALKSMSSAWKSHISHSVKRSFFQATLENVLLYGCEAWTININPGKVPKWMLHLHAQSSSQHQVVAACTKLRAV